MLDIFAAVIAALMQFHREENCKQTAVWRPNDENSVIKIQLISDFKFNYFSFIPLDRFNRSLIKDGKRDDNNDDDDNGDGSMSDDDTHTTQSTSRFAHKIIILQKLTENDFRRNKNEIRFIHLIKLGFWVCVGVVFVHHRNKSMCCMCVRRVHIWCASCRLSPLAYRACSPSPNRTKSNRGKRYKEPLAAFIGTQRVSESEWGVNDCVFFFCDNFCVGCVSSSSSAFVFVFARNTFGFRLCVTWE